VEHADPSLTPDEACQLCAELAAHVAEWGAQLHAPHPQRWYLRLPESPGIRTSTPHAALTEGLSRHMPVGEQAGRWASRLTELQMVLHSSPVNAARATRGLPIINSLWLWGEGCLPTTGGGAPLAEGGDWHVVFADDVLSRALADWRGVDWQALPSDAGGLLARVAEAPLQARVLLVLDSLAVPARRLDLEAWRAALQALDERWLAPLCAALEAGALQTLCLFDDEGTRLQRRRPGWPRRLLGGLRGRYDLAAGMAALGRRVRTDA
ncbi:MAG: hypothetical protein KDK91_32310, partial [Gammaproteobacteria bacterium]|nr:hypothetical protein [Gammaproteobacteria bacterium]